ncbi:hypothetical protein ABZZ17_04200 [Streptomyces sp. NPDC006512]|uniref:hypothetical protein n=1 Tax=Streptomyces sp. NPDC006512 TaxID=3154307 RepID=UPI0033BCAE0B
MRKGWAAAPPHLGAVVSLALLTGCSPVDETPIGRTSGHGTYRPLAVVGYPSPQTLDIVQEVVGRIADEDPGELTFLAGDRAGTAQARATAENWVEAFGDGARGRVTADFYDEGSKRQLVVLYFHNTRQIKAITVSSYGNAERGGWRAEMDEPGPEEAAAPPAPWIPAEPGGAGSKTPV